MLELQNVKVHVQEAEAAYVRKVTDLSEAATWCRLMIRGDVVMVGDVRIEAGAYTGSHARQPVLPGRRTAGVG